VQRDDSHKVFLGHGLGGQTSRCRILKQEFFNTTSNIFNAEFSFGTLVSRSEENDSLIVIKSVLFAELITNLLNTLFKVCSEVSFADTQFIAILG